MCLPVPLSKSLPGAVNSNVICPSEYDVEVTLRSLILDGGWFKSLGKSPPEYSTLLEPADVCLENGGAGVPVSGAIGIPGRVIGSPSKANKS